MISQTPTSLFDNNFAIAKVKEDLQKWDKLHITLAGRIQSIKMNIVPRFLYFFQCLPLFLPKSFFITLNGIFSSFIWGNKPPRLQRALLQRSRTNGGIGLPDLKHYYWACTIHKILYWVFYPTTQWCQLESNSCRSSLRALICYPEALKPKPFTENPVTIATLKIWQQIKHNFNWKTLPLSTPICNNMLFKPAQTDGRFTVWEQQGLGTIGDFFTDGVFPVLNFAPNLIFNHLTYSDISRFDIL